MGYEELVSGVSGNDPELGASLEAELRLTRLCLVEQAKLRSDRWADVSDARLFFLSRGRFDVSGWSGLEVEVFSPDTWRWSGGRVRERVRGPHGVVMEGEGLVRKYVLCAPGSMWRRAVVGWWTGERRAVLA